MGENPHGTTTGSSSQFESAKLGKGPTLEELEQAMQEAFFQEKPSQSQAPTDRTSSAEATGTQGGKGKEKARETDPSEDSSEAEQPSRLKKGPFYNLRNQLHYSPDRKQIWKDLPAEYQAQQLEFDQWEELARRYPTMASYVGSGWDAMIHQEMERIASGEPTNPESERCSCQQLLEVANASLDHTEEYTEERVRFLKERGGGIFTARREEIKSMEEAGHMARLKLENARRRAERKIRELERQ